MVIELMEVGKNYRIKVKGKEDLFLTGKVIDKTPASIRFLTIRNEDMILGDEEVAWAKINTKRNEGEVDDQ